MKTEIDKTTSGKSSLANGFLHKNGFANGHVANGKPHMNGAINNDFDENQQKQRKFRDQVSQILHWINQR